MMELKKIINLLRETEGYISFNAEFANEIADALEKVENEKENLIDYNADLNNRLDKAESYIEKLEKQLSEKQEWISVEDEAKPNEGEKVIIHSATGTVSIHFYFDEVGFPRFVTHWMKYEQPKPKEPTFKDVFLKAFPKAKLYDGGTPVVCAKGVFPQIGDYDECCDLICHECWDQLYFEEEGGEE